MKKYIYITLLISLLFNISNAQTLEYGTEFEKTTTHYENLRPLNLKEWNITIKENKNQCFQKCLFADKWTTATEQRIRKEASTEIKIRPPVFDTIIETVLIHSLFADTNSSIKKYKKDTLVIVKIPIRSTVIEIPAEYDTFTKRKLVGKCGGFIETVEVLCPNLLDEHIVGKIQLELKDEGYYTGINTGIFDIKTKKALYNYQRLNHQCTGILDLKTLKSLGIL